jgi:hypothetical protein
MSEVLISNPFVEVNDVKISTYGNSITYDNGLPDIGVTPISAGGGGVTTVHGVDITTAKGMVKFKLPSTKKNDELTIDWKSGVGTNTIKFYDGKFQKVLRNASSTTGREFELNSAEGGIEVIFEGDPIAT